MKKLLVLLLCLGLIGCTTVQLVHVQNSFRRRPGYALNETLDYSKEAIYTVAQEAIKKASNGELNIKYMNLEEGVIYAQNVRVVSAFLSYAATGRADVVDFGIFLKGDNPTEVEIRQADKKASTDFKYIVMQNIKSMLQSGNMK